jgi:ABC-2 type transport system ATP-binding protein
VREFILEIKQQGRTIFICTHNLDEADRLCDRIGVFKTHLLVLDSPAKLRRQVFGRKVVFHLKEADEALVEKLNQHPQVSEASLVEQKILATIEDPETHNPELIRLLVNEGADVQFVGELRRSLEDVYLQLVKNA